MKAAKTKVSKMGKIGKMGRMGPVLFSVAVAVALLAFAPPFAFAGETDATVAPEMTADGTAAASVEGGGSLDAGGVSSDVTVAEPVYVEASGAETAGAADAVDGTGAASSQEGADLPGAGGAEDVESVSAADGAPVESGDVSTDAGEGVAGDEPANAGPEAGCSDGNDGQDSDSDDAAGTDGATNDEGTGAANDVGVDGESPGLGNSSGASGDGAEGDAGEAGGEAAVADGSSAEGAGSSDASDAHSGVVSDETGSQEAGDAEARGGNGAEDGGDVAGDAHVASPNVGAVVGEVATPEDAETDAANAAQLQTLLQAAADCGLDTEEMDAALKAAAAEGASKSDLLNLVKKIIVSAVTGDPGKIAETLIDFGVGELLNAMFGTPVEDKDETSMRDILEKLNLIVDSLTDLQNTVDSQQLDNVLTGLQSRLNAQGLTAYVIFDTLKKYDDQQKAGTKSAEEARADRLKALTKDMHIDELSAVNNGFDLYVQDLWDAMTQTYPVTIHKKPKDLTLMQVFYEHLRMKYHWENQAYDEWASYQARYVGLLLTSLSLEKASLQARIDLLKAKGETYDSVKTLLAITQDRINQVVGYKGKDSTGKKDVDYPGIFSEKTWASQYWMYKERDDSERYYWTPGHEIVFDSEITTQYVPQESTNVGLATGGLGGLIVSYYYDGAYHVVQSVTVNPGFYLDFLYYKFGTSQFKQLASADQLKMLCADYGGDVHLDTIFMSNKEGNFQMSGKHDYTDWRFVVSMDDAHQLVYNKKSDSSGNVSYTVLAPWNKDENKVLWYYYGKSTEAGSGLHFVGIGVKSVGQDTGNSNGSNQNPQNGLRWFTEVLYPEDLAIWWPSRGDLALGYSAEAYGTVNQVFMDGKLLDESCYMLEDGQITLTKAFVSSLGFGEHELVLDAKDGNHTVVFSTQADGVYYVESGDGSSWTPGSGDGTTFVFKRTTDDEVTFSRLLDVLVDGVSVPSWGYVACAGSAVVTLAAAFLDTLAPGVHTLTAIFADGNDPQVTFTVNAAGALPVATTGAAGPAQPEQTPRTGDGAALPIALLALVALASAGVAVRARRQAA